ncbi:glycosyltransferase family 4 protein [Legionella geestiana]|uniref:glycosyltransferase family 4 protein n=1 Tax=Legionella geestiana TaxID=45065 RepID=UPI0010928450|nr:glycosyltransferase family 4 protein [Legionella geestiana]QDQ40003.1 glycosyltransferase family 4 protein [Legionella geestiana]
MKICFLSAMHAANDKRVFDKEAVSLAQAGFEVMHLCPADHESEQFSKNVRTITYPKPVGIWERILQLPRLFFRARRLNANVYHCNEVDSWIVGIMLKIFCRKTCVFDVHEHYPSVFAESRFPRPLQPLVAGIIRALFRVLTPLTDRLVLAKITVADDFPNAAEKTVLVRNFTPLSALNFSGARTFPGSEEPLRMVHLGLFGRGRGWPQVLDAMHRMQNRKVELLVIGEFNDGSLEDFRARARELSLEDRITCLPWMSFTEALEHLAKSHVGLVTFQPGIQNHVYAMPHKMFDYMAAGMAVICPDFAVEVAPVISESQAGLLVNPADVDALARAFDQLVNDHEQTQAMGERGQNAVKNRYNWETECARLIDMYQELAVIAGLKPAGAQEFDNSGTSDASV